MINMGYVAFDKKKLSRDSRIKIEKLLGLDGPLPIYECDARGWLGVEPPGPYWEYWPQSSCPWIIRFTVV